MLTQPKQGVLSVAQGQHFPKCAADQKKHACNQQKVPSALVCYPSKPGFTGADSTPFEVIFPGGGVRKVTRPITVRPAELAK